MNFQFPGIDNIYCKYSYVYGPDWEQIAGLEEGLSSKCECGSAGENIVIGMPLQATFSSTNPFGCTRDL